MTTHAAAVTSADELLLAASIAPPHGTPARAFGRSLAVEGDLAVVGAPTEFSNGLVTHGAAYVFTRSGGRWRLRTRLAPPDGTLNMEFGSAVAIADGQILVGAPKFSAAGDARGALFVYDGSGGVWSESQRVVGTGAMRDFGGTLAYSDDTVLVGAPFENAQRGAAYVFVRTGGTWSQQARLEGDAGDGQFGQALALDGDRAIVGAPFGPGNRGSAFVFERGGSQWTQGVRLAPPVSVSAFAGKSVAVSGDLVLIGAPSHDADGVDRSGAVFVYARVADTWTLAQTLQTATQEGLQFGDSLQFEGADVTIGAPGALRAWGRRGLLFGSVFAAGQFTQPQVLPEDTMRGTAGLALARDGDTLLVSGHGDNVGAVNFDGLVSVLQRQAGIWRPSGVLDAARGVSMQRSGHALALSGQRAAVAAPWRDVAGAAERGAVDLYAFDGQRWNYQATVVDPTGSVGDRFGTSVALDGDHLLVGAPKRDNGAAVDGGSALFFAFDGVAWVLASRHDDSAGSGDRFGTSVSLSGSVAAVGAPWSEHGGQTDGGLAVVFEHDGTAWNAVSHLAGSSANEHFGDALAVAAGTLAVGAPGAASGAGRVGLYRKIAGTWGQLVSLGAPTGASAFGDALALTGTRLAIAAPAAHAGAGGIWMYRNQSGSWLADSGSLTAPATRALGTSIALDGDALVAGSLDTGGAPSAMHVFVRAGAGTWNSSGRRNSPDGSAVAPDGFGEALARAGDHLLAGAQWRAGEEGRMFAYVAGRPTQVTIDAVTPAAPVAGQTVSVQLSVDTPVGLASGEVRVAIESGGVCSAPLIGGAALCELVAGDVGSNAISAQFVPSTLPALGADTTSALTVQIAQSQVQLLATPLAVHPGETVTLQAAVTALDPASGLPAGVVTFHRDNVATPPLCTTSAASATCMVIPASVGTHQYVAHYAGGGNFAASNSAPRNIDVSAWQTTTVLDVTTPQPARVDTPLTASVDVTAGTEAGIPQGRVRLVLDGVPGDWHLLDAAGHASPDIVPPQAGSSVLSAQFDAMAGNFEPSSSDARAIKIDPLTSTLVITSTPEHPQAGDVLRLDASIATEDGSVATGAVRFHRGTADTPALCVTAAPAAFCEILADSSGAWVFAAVYDGDDRIAADSATLSLVVAPRVTATTLVGTAPGLPGVDAPFDVVVAVSAAWGTPSGTVHVSDGTDECLAPLDQGMGRCQLVAALRGPRTIDAVYLPDDTRHAGSNAEPLTLDIAGIETDVALTFSPGPYRIGDTVTLTPSVASLLGGAPEDGLLTVRRDGDSGPILCVSAPPANTCDADIEHAGQQVFHVGYDGGARHAPSSSTAFSVTADPLTSGLVWRGSVPETPTVGAPFTLHARVQASLGVPTGTMDFADTTGTVCHAVPVDTAGDAQCQVPASATTGLRQFVLRFESATDDYTDASLDGVDIVVVDGVRSVRVSIDNAGHTFHPGALLDYTIELRDESSAGESEVHLQMLPPIGTVGMLWTCTSGFGGAACPPDAAPVSGTLNAHALLPAGGALCYEASMTVTEPTPDRIEATVVATLPASMANDDPAALIGTDVDYHIATPMFVDGFEPPVPQLHADSMAKAWQGLAAWPEDAVGAAANGSTRTLLQVRLHGRLVGWREAARRDGVHQAREIWWDAATAAWIPGPWQSR